MLELVLTALLLVVSLAISILWVKADAVRRGHNPRDAVLIALICWPASLSLWIMVRSHHQLAPEGMGSPWG